MKLSDFKEKLLKDERFREEYYAKDLLFEVGNLIIEARIIKGMTQEELARKMGTKQPSIARAENGSYLPSLGFLERMAKALDTYLIPPKFGFMETRYNQYNIGDVLEGYYESKNDVVEFGSRASL